MVVVEVKFVGVPMHLGADRYGLNFSIKKLLRSYPTLNADIKVVDVVYSTKDDEYNEKLKYVSTIAQVSEEVAHEVNKIVKSGKLAVTIGGDHSIAIGSIAGVAKEKKVGVLWVDAHADLNTPQTTPSGHIHGMPLAVSQGYGDKRLTQCFYAGSKVDAKNVVVLGARDLDAGELEFVAQNQCHLVGFDQLQPGHLIEKLEEIYGYLIDGTEGVHVSVDLDVLNPQICPGVSTPVAGGFSLAELELILSFLMAKGTLVSIDLVEYNPVYDRNDTTLHILLNLIKKIQQYGYQKAVGSQVASAQ